MFSIRWDRFGPLVGVIKLRFDYVGPQRLVRTKACPVRMSTDLGGAPRSQEAQDALHCSGREPGSGRRLEPRSGSAPGEGFVQLFPAVEDQEPDRTAHLFPQGCITALPTLDGLEAAIPRIAQTLL